MSKKDTTTINYTEIAKLVGLPLTFIITNLRYAAGFPAAIRKTYRGVLFDKKSVLEWLENNDLKEAIKNGRKNQDDPKNPFNNELCSQLNRGLFAPGYLAEQFKMKRLNARNFHKPATRQRVVLKGALHG